MRRRSRAAVTTFVALGLVLGGCGSDEETARGGRGGSGGPGGPGGRPEQTIPVAVERVSVGAASSYYSSTATLEAENRAEILSRATGVVQQIVREEGDRVEKGALLLLLEDDEAKLRVQQSEANLALANAEFDRRQSMLEGGLLSAEEFETTQNNLALRESDYELAKLELSYTRIVAPFAGQIVRRNVDLGANVTPGVALFELMDVTPLLARIHVPGKRMGFLEAGQDIELTLDSTGETLAGRIRLVSPIVDTATGTIKVTAEIQEYPTGTRPGDFAHVRIVTARNEDALLVPSRAIFEEQGQTIVFVAEEDQAARRPVSTGFVDGDFTEVTEGIEAGELVVVKGQRQLRDEMKIEILEGPPEVVASTDSTSNSS